MSEAQALAPAVEERVAVASNWTLVWWRFRKHYLALVSAFVLACLYAVVLCPDFFSTQNPELTDARQAFIPVQPLHFLDGGRFRPIRSRRRRRAPFPRGEFRCRSKP